MKQPDDEAVRSAGAGEERSRPGPPCSQPCPGCVCFRCGSREVAVIYPVVERGRQVAVSLRGGPAIPLVLRLCAGCEAARRIGA